MCIDNFHRVIHTPLNEIFIHVQIYIDRSVNIIKTRDALQTSNQFPRWIRRSVYAIFI